MYRIKKRSWMIFRLGHVFGRHSLYTHTIILKEPASIVFYKPNGWTKTCVKQSKLLFEIMCCLANLFYLNMWFSLASYLISNALAKTPLVVQSRFICLNYCYWPVIIARSSNKQWTFTNHSAYLWSLYYTFIVALLSRQFRTILDFFCNYEKYLFFFI